MHAVQIRAAVEVGEQTDIDPRDKQRRLTFRRPARRTRERIEASPEPAPEPTLYSLRAAAPRGPSRLSDLRVRESIQRRTARRKSTTARTAQSGTTSVVEIAWVRCNDTQMSAFAADRDGLMLEGRGAGEVRSSRSRPGSAAGRQTKSTLSVGVDGHLFTVEVRAGDTAANVLRRLSGRLESRYVVELTHDSAHSSTLRLRRERFGR